MTSCGNLEAIQPENSFGFSLARQQQNSNDMDFHFRERSDTLEHEVVVNPLFLIASQASSWNEKSHSNHAISIAPPTNFTKVLSSKKTNLNEQQVCKQMFGMYLRFTQDGSYFENAIQEWFIHAPQRGLYWLRTHVQQTEQDAKNYCDGCEECGRHGQYVSIEVLATYDESGILVKNLKQEKFAFIKRVIERVHWKFARFGFTRLQLDNPNH